MGFADDLAKKLRGDSAKPKDEPKSDDEAPAATAKTAAVRRFFEAGGKGDWKAATSAFRAAYDACIAEEKAGPDEEMAEGEEE